MRARAAREVAKHELRRHDGRRCEVLSPHLRLAVPLLHPWHRKKFSPASGPMARPNQERPENYSELLDASLPPKEERELCNLLSYLHIGRTP